MVIGVKLRQRYQISRVLGSGAFGDTYLAEDLDLPNHPQCVVKHLQIKPPNTAAALPIARRLFAQEAETLDISENYLTFTTTAFEEMKVKCKDTQIIR